MGKTNKNSATNKADLARAGTMELTSKEGRAFLEKNLTEWKKPLLLDQETAVSVKVDAGENNDDADVKPPSAKKAKLSKATTMDATAKEGKALLGGKKLGDTRQVTKAAQKKSAVKRAGTMQQAVAEAAAVYGDLTDCGSEFSRKTTGVAVSAKKTKAAPKKGVKKAKAASKSAAKKAAKKGAMKKFGTMCNTAKEAKQLLGGEELGDTRQVTKAKQATK